MSRLPLPDVDAALAEIEYALNPLLQPDDRASIDRHNALELFPRLRPGTVVH